MLHQPKRDRPKDPRFLLDCGLWNGVTIWNHTPLPNIAEAIELRANRPCWSKLYLIVGYHDICIGSHWDKHTTFLCHMEHYRRRVMQQLDCNAGRTIVRAKNLIFPQTIFQHLIMYIDDIIISSSNYKEHVVALCRVLPNLQDQQFCF